jgi:aminopeptidase N
MYFKKSFMKYILLLLVFFVGNTYGQQERQDAESLARMEMQAHQNQFNQTTARTLASNNFDVKYYRCEWEVDPAIRFITGKVTVYFVMTTSSASITLDLMNTLTVDSIKNINTPYTFLQTSNTLDVNFPSTLNEGVLDSVSIWYKGIPANTGFGSFIQDVHGGTPVMWTLSESYGSRDWWPCKNGINDKADSIDVFITNPDIYKGASNGMLQSETALPGGKVMSHWKHRYPIASYLVCMAVTNYVTFNNSVLLGSTNLPMLTYCYPENLAVWQTNTPNVLQAMQLFHNTFGPYPFMNEKYGHVQFGWGGGMEHQTSTFIINTSEPLMAHELGHQWFGDKITCNSWEDIWLNEGFATFLAAYHMETKYPSNALANRRNIVNNITSQPGGILKIQDTTNLNQIFNGRLSYNKGSYLLNMLRFILGDVVFFNAIRRYEQDPLLAYGNASTADLKRNLEAESGKDLTYFFNQWYTGEGYPTYQVQWNVVDNNCVNITLNQTTSVPASVPFFRLPVQLTFKNATQEKIIVLDNIVNNENFIRSVGFTADTVLVDPGVWLVTRNNSTVKGPQVNNGGCSVLALPIDTIRAITSRNSGKGGVDIYPNPVTNPFRIRLHDFKDDKATITIYNKIGQRLYNRQVPLVNGIAQVDVPMGSWSKGFYTIKVVAGGKNIIRQVVK